MARKPRTYSVDYAANKLGLHAKTVLRYAEWNLIDSVKNAKTGEVRFTQDAINSFQRAGEADRNY